MAGLPITIPAFAESRTGAQHFFGTRPAGRETWVGASRGEPPRDCSAQELLKLTGRQHARSPSRVARVVSVRQVHGTDVLVLDRPVAEGEAFSGEWDAMVTNQQGVLLTVRTADCVPILIHDPLTRAVAAVHAGWRGGVAGILPKTVTLMQELFGSEPASMHVGIGPSVGPCCYEIDAPVLEPLRASFPDWSSVVRETGRDTARLDLRQLVQRQAEGMGIIPRLVKMVRVCTACYPELFYSYRRDGVVNGTMISGIMLTHRRRSS